MHLHLQRGHLTERETVQQLRCSRLGLFKLPPSEPLKQRNERLLLQIWHLHEGVPLPPARRRR